MLQRSTLPNAITLARVVLAPIVFFLALTPLFTTRLLAFILFLAAAFSDIWDGHLARKYGWISDFGKLVDPIADKLLLVATMTSFYIISRRPGPDMEFPFLDPFPLWILIVVFGRELAITLMRAHAARRGVVIPAGRAGKHKAIYQSIFMGAGLAWYAALSLGVRQGWAGLPAWSSWLTFHSLFVIVSLAVAIFMTVASLGVYLLGWRRLLRGVE